MRPQSSLSSAHIALTKELAAALEQADDLIYSAFLAALAFASSILPKYYNSAPQGGDIFIFHDDVCLVARQSKISGQFYVYAVLFGGGDSPDPSPNSARSLPIICDIDLTLTVEILNALGLANGQASIFYQNRNRSGEYSRDPMSPSEYQRKLQISKLIAASAAEFEHLEPEPRQSIADPRGAKFSSPPGMPAINATGAPTVINAVPTARDDDHPSSSFFSCAPAAITWRLVYRAHKGSPSEANAPS